MFFKRLLDKNLLLIFALVLLISVFVVPQFLDEKKVEAPSQQKVEVVGENSNLEPKENQPEVLSQESQNSNTPTTQNKPVQKSNPTQQNTQTLPSTNEAGEPVARQVSLNIHTGVGNYSYNVNWVEKMTVFEVLDLASKLNNFSLKYTNYGSWGAFITELHGVSGDWVYEVNGNPPMGENAGASKFVINENDIITWKKP